MRIFLLLVLAATSAMAQVTTTPIDGLRNKQLRLVAYTNCVAIPAPGERIDSAVIIVRDERIVAVGKRLSIPAGADVRDLQGAFVYSAFVEPYLNSKTFAKGTPAGNEAGWDEDEDPTTPPAKGATYWNHAVKPEYRASGSITISDATATEWNKLGYGVAAASNHDGIFRGSAATVLLRGGTASTTLVSDMPYQAMSFRKGSSKTPYPSSQMGSIALIRQTFYDADWYGKAHTAASRGVVVPAPEINLSLAALRSAIDAKTPFVTECADEHDCFRWQHIADEFSVRMILKGSGSEYRRLPRFAATRPEIILPLTFPDAPDVKDPVAARNVGLTDLISWYWAADNPRLLDSVGCTIAFTTDGLKDKQDLLPRIRESVRRGFDSTKALAALTTVPARIAGVEDRVGRIAKGYYANLIIMSAPLFDAETEMRGIVVAGTETPFVFTPDVDMRGHWTLSSSALGSSRSVRVSITGKIDRVSAEVRKDSISIPSTLTVAGRTGTLSLKLDTLGTRGFARTYFATDSILITGQMILPNGSTAPFTLRRDSTLRKPSIAAAPPKEEPRRPLPKMYPLGPYGLAQPPRQLSVVLKNATVWTCGPQGTLENTDVVLSGGKITAIGKGLSADTTIDCTGMHITPGIIDEHSHIAISRGVNEGTHAVTTEVRIGDVVDPDDVNIYRQLTGGVTGSHLLHGSANPMGGQLQYIKLRWGADAEGLKVENAVPTVKFALGENVKQSNWGDRFSVRYPQSRMGVEQIMRDAFQAAREYERERAVETPARPVRRDIQLDALVEIVNGKRKIHCHSYVQSEILMLMRLAEEFGFRVHTFTHILEGYKVAKEMAAHGAGASSFADWWAYKFEVYDAIPENPAILEENGVLVSVNSDDAEMARRLNQEASKSVKYGGTNQEDAMRFVTINAAKQMMNDAATGSIEVQKDADVVVWSGNPLSGMSRVERTFVDGRMYFSRDVDAQLRKRDAELRAFLEQEALRAAEQGAATSSGGRRGRREYHCDTDDDEMAGSGNGR